MRKHNLKILFLSLLLLVSVLYIIKQTITFQQEKAEFKILSTSINYYIIESIKNGDLIINDLSLKSNSEDQKISKILDKDKLIIYLPNIDCHSCTSKEVELIKKIFPDSIRQQIIVIAKVENKREIKLFERFSGLQTYGITNNDFLFSNNHLIKPTLFIARPSLQTYAYFVPYHDNPQISIMYYYSVLDKLSNKEKK